MKKPDGADVMNWISRAILVGLAAWYVARIAEGQHRAWLGLGMLLAGFAWLEWWKRKTRRDLFGAMVKGWLVRDAERRECPVCSAPVWALPVRSRIDPESFRPIAWRWSLSPHPPLGDEKARGYIACSGSCTVVESAVEASR